MDEYYYDSEEYEEKEEEDGYDVSSGGSGGEMGPVEEGGFITTQKGNTIHHDIRYSDTEEKRKRNGDAYTKSRKHQHDNNDDDAIKPFLGKEAANKQTPITPHHHNHHPHPRNASYLSIVDGIPSKMIDADVATASDPPLGWKNHHTKKKRQRQYRDGGSSNTNTNNNNNNNDNKMKNKQTTYFNKHPRTVRFREDKGEEYKGEKSTLPRLPPMHHNRKKSFPKKTGSKERSYKTTPLLSPSKRLLGGSTASNRSSRAKRVIRDRFDSFGIEEDGRNDDTEGGKKKKGGGEGAIRDEYISPGSRRKKSYMSEGGRKTTDATTIVAEDDGMTTHGDDRVTISAVAGTHHTFSEKEKGGLIISRKERKPKKSSTSHRTSDYDDDDDGILIENAAELFTTTDAHEEMDGGGEGDYSRNGYHKKNGTEGSGSYYYNNLPTFGRGKRRIYDPVEMYNMVRTKYMQDCSADGLLHWVQTKGIEEGIVCVHSARSIPSEKLPGLHPEKATLEVRIANLFDPLNARPLHPEEDSRRGFQPFVVPYSSKSPYSQIYQKKYNWVIFLRVGSLEEQIAEHMLGYGEMRKYSSSSSSSSTIVLPPLEHEEKEQKQAETPLSTLLRPSHLLTVDHIRKVLERYARQYPRPDLAPIELLQKIRDILVVKHRMKKTNLTAAIREIVVEKQATERQHELTNVGIPSFTRVRSALDQARKHMQSTAHRLVNEYLKRNDDGDDDEENDE